MKRIIFLILLKTIFSYTVIAKNNDSLVIHFSLLVNTIPFELGTNYTTSSGDTFQAHKMKFYISGLKGITAGRDTIILSNTHFLIDAANSTSQTISIHNNTSITALLFTIGVDSLRNTSGIQNGVLDPAKGMFWTWNSGYVMAKMEGISTLANTAGNRFTHDVGGFKYPFNSTRKIRLAITQNNLTNSFVDISVNLANWFTGKHTISLKEQPICHTPGILAMQLADNFATCFTTVKN